MFPRLIIVLFFFKRYICQFITTWSRFKKQIRQCDDSIRATRCMKFFFQKENTRKCFLENEWNQWRVQTRVTTVNLSQHIMSLEEDWKSFEDPQSSKFLFGFHLMKRYWLVSTPTSDLSRPRRVASATNVHFQL